MKVKILCDSASDLSQEDLEQFGIDMVPLRVTLQGEEYEDGITISPKEVYDAMREGAAPKTSQVSPQAFRDAFINYAKNEQPFVYFAFSSGLSGTYQTAKMVEQEVKDEYPNAKFEVRDTKAASLGYGLVILRIAELAAEGASLKEIVDTGTYHAEHMEHIFTVDNLEYLYRGGRVSRTSAFVGSLLKIKPLLHMEDGNLVPLEKIRGSKKVFKRMIEVMAERGTDLQNQRIAISHADARDTAEYVADLIRSEFTVKDIHIDMVGSTIGAHAGPGTIALFFLNHPYK
ncbi:DegV family protein [Halobacillus rhizosphaerae]|uniref:DegV family protein n=1 Tax=Halobacillus rhizosphaerae TaxID=3064889 RepID=UPI00398B2E0F